MTSDALICRGLEKSYGDGAERVSVIKGVSLNIGRGEMVMVTGPSGGGKSTLLGMASGLLRPDQGSVVVGDDSVWSLSTKHRDQLRRDRFGFVFQGFNLFSSLTALQQVVFPLIQSGVAKKMAIEQGSNTLARVGMGDKQHLIPRQLSGGEKQRVAIARALAKSPQIVFADEPTSALDSKNGLLVIELLRSLCTHSDVAVLAVTHDFRLHAYADRIAHLEDGELVDIDSANEQMGSNHVE